jgi:hypothetical protein
MANTCKRVMSLGEFRFRPGRGTGESRHAPRLEFVLGYDGDNPSPLMELLGENERGAVKITIAPKADGVERWSQLCQVKRARWTPSESGRGLLRLDVYRETHETAEMLEFVRMRFDMDTADDANADVTITIVQASLPFEGGERDA